MRVVLMRHGEAVDARLARSDERRWLTDGGRRQVTAVGNTLVELGLSFSCVYTSPLVRSVQTAEILAATQPDFDGPVEVHVPLSSDEGTVAQALAPLDHAGEHAVVVLVSHMPKVEVLGGQLCQMDRFASFRTGAACLIDLDEGRGQFQWMLDPETLKRERP
ncbi:MAG: histidine phosphatase family protein [Myxococcota bacterium]